MEKIKILWAMALGLLTFASCDDEPHAFYADPTEFVLNTPSYVNGAYDLENSKSIELSCSQPDYGFTAATTYSVQVSLNGNFTDEGSYSTLPTTYTKARMAVAADELAEAMTALSTADPEAFPYNTPLYVRLKAQLTKSGKGEIFSNVVSIPNVRLYYALPAVVPPTSLYLVGSHCNWKWEDAISMIPTYDNNGTFWHLVYIDAGGSVKFNWDRDWNGNEVGFAGIDGHYSDNAGAGIGSTDDGNIRITNAGWYLLVIRTAVAGRGYQFSLEVNKPNVYLFGSTKGGTNAWAADDDGLFTVPDSKDGEFVSPAFAADADPESGVRACVIIDGEDWWHSEFMVINGKLAYRATGGDQERITGNAGQRLYINFTNETGHIN